MKIKSIRVNGFRRFESLSILDLPPARLVVMAGPNGSGKSSLFDAFSVWQQANGYGVGWETDYHERGNNAFGFSNQVEIDFHSHPAGKKTFYVRSAYRNDPEFKISYIQNLPMPTENIRIRRMIEQDGAVGENYQHIIGDAFKDAFERADERTTLKQFRDETIGHIRDATLRLFPDLNLNTLGNPLHDGTFKFSKGPIKGFSYKNLSAGEKAAFDIILDMIVKSRTYDDTVFAIDEPEVHINTRLQGALLNEMYNLIPNGSQMWIATHSIGMMKKARDLYNKNPGDVIFLDFEGHDYDNKVSLNPVAPVRSFWERVLRVALDDLADLVAPQTLVICEGNPKTPVGGKNEEHDARCYETIFSAEFPDTKFVSGGGSKDVIADRLKFVAVFPHVVPGLKILRLIDRDDHAPPEVENFLKEGIRTLRRRHIESYLYDDEVLSALYGREGRSADFSEILKAKQEALTSSIARNNPADDLKSAARDIYIFAKRHLQLTGCGDDQAAFARNVLAPLIKPGMKIYDELKEEVMGFIN